MTFRIAPGWRLFVYVTCFIFLAVAFWTIYTFFDCQLPIISDRSKVEDLG